MKILFIGDIVGKIGRKAVAAVLPGLRKEHGFDLVIANGENMAHGSGFTPQTAEEVFSSGVDFMTSGNHWARKSEGVTLFSDPSVPLIRPANWAGRVPGTGYRIIEVGATRVAIINLIGQVFMQEQTDHPFHVFDRVLKEIPNGVRIIIVDYHAEATSEKQAFGWYADGRVSLVVGTHTHVPTADVRILEQGTGYITDIGMSGARDSVIGDVKEVRVAQFVNQLPAKHDGPESGDAFVQAIVATVDPITGKTKSIERLDTRITV